MNITARAPMILLAVGLAISATMAAAGARQEPDDPHARISCAACHGGRVVRATAAAARLIDGPDPRSRTCHECHQDLRAARPAAATTGTNLGFHGDPQADCVNCHTFHERGRLKTAVGDLRTGNNGLVEAVAGHCQACHGRGRSLMNLSPAHREAAALYHRDAELLAQASPSQGCLNCHAEGSTSTWLRETSGANLTFNLHATHPLGVDVVPGSGADERRLRAVIDPKLQLFAGRLECQTCHDLTASTTDLLVAFEQPHDLCLGCHRLSNPKSSSERREMMAAMMPLEAP